jgi:hypothetical protein
MRTIAAVARILQIVNSTNYTVSSIGSFTHEPVPSPTPSLSATAFASYSPAQTFNMSGYYSGSPAPSAAPSTAPSASVNVTPSNLVPSTVPTVAASLTPTVSPIVTTQNTSPFYALTPELWAYILVPCISFALITLWCNVRVWSRVNDLDHQLKLYQSLRIQNNPMNHHSVRNIIPGLPLPSGNKAAFSNV